MLKKKGHVEITEQLWKEKKTMRTKQKIDQDIESKTDSLNFSIEASIKHEQVSEDYHKKLKKELKVLRAETPFEDTLAGQAQAFTVAVEQKIKILLDELKQKTGIELKCNLVSESKSTGKHFFAFPQQKHAFKVQIEQVLMNPRHTPEAQVDKVLNLVDEIL